MEIIVCMDHESLAGVCIKKDLPCCMQCFVDILEHFDPKMVYRPGRGNALADWLSRPPDASVYAIAENIAAKPKLPHFDNLSWIDL
jgi:hypothetical protein